jgi:glycine hydroxymethyltransferase
LALAEAKKYGKAYATQVIRNSKTLAKALDDHGFPVICKHLNYTDSHQTILDYGDYEKGRTIAKKLQKANVITDCVIRIGTDEITRRGMKQPEMTKVAELIKRIVIDEENPENIKREIVKLNRQFRETKYCYEK